MYYLMIRLKKSDSAKTLSDNPESLKDRGGMLCFIAIRENVRDLKID